MSFKYKTVLKRQRIPYMREEFCEMHRNARVDYYPDEIAMRIRDTIDFTHLNRYPNVEKLQNNVAKFLGLAPENILLTSGIDGGIKTVFEMCTKIGDKVVTLWPTYGMYDVYSRAFGIKTIDIKSREDLSINIDEIIEKIDKDVSVVFLPNPHQPIENLFSCAQIEKVAQKALEFDVVLFVDEAYFMFGAQTAISLVEKYPNVVVARTFSKGFGLPAIRVGFLVSNPEFISYLETKRFAHETNYLSIEIASFAIENYALFESYINEVNTAREWIKASLAELGYKTHGAGSNSVIIDMITVCDKEAVANVLKDLGYLVRSNIPYPFDKYISVTVGSIDVMRGFLGAFKEFLQISKMKDN